MNINDILTSSSINIVNSDKGACIIVDGEKVLLDQITLTEAVLLRLVCGKIDIGV